MSYNSEDDTIWSVFISSKNLPLKEEMMVCLLTLKYTQQCQRAIFSKKMILWVPLVPKEQVIYCVSLIYGFQLHYLFS